MKVIWRLLKLIEAGPFAVCIGTELVAIFDCVCPYLLPFIKCSSGAGRMSIFMQDLILKFERKARKLHLMVKICVRCLAFCHVAIRQISGGGVRPTGLEQKDALWCPTTQFFMLIAGVCFGGLKISIGPKHHVPRWQKKGSLFTPLTGKAPKWIHFWEWIQL